MHKFDYSETWQRALTPDIVALLTQIHEYKGRQVLFGDFKAETLAQITEIAKVQSTEASNKIEGIFTSDDRLKKLVGDKTRPRNTNEQQIAGYRDVLSAIHENYAYLPFKPNMISQLHQTLYKYSGTASSGGFKVSDNVTEAIENLCTAYENILKDGNADPLVIFPMAVLDFLCIEPFNEGNGRMGRLLLLLLLCQSGYFAGKYISIEKLIWQSEEAYAEALRRSTGDWNENGNDYLPFIKYFLGIVLTAYEELFGRTELLTKKGFSKPDRVASVIQNASDKITKTEILRQCTDVSEITVQRTLAELLQNGDIIKIGGGRYTQYVWNREKEQ